MSGGWAPAQASREAPEPGPLVKLEPIALVVPIVLAAGRSERMGSPKALLDLGGVTALGRIAGTALAAGSAPPLVVVGHHAEAVRAEALRLGCGVVVNPEPDRGQTSSLQEGLCALPEDAEAFFVWPVDVPLVESASLAALVAALRSHGPKARAALPRFEGRRGHPALVSISLRDELLALEPREPARRAILRDPGRVLEVEVPDSHVLDRLDTPEDLAVLRASMGW